jgi:hypothetical protein
VREESHLDDMRAAIRGDFERLAQRRGAQELMQEQDPEPEPDPEPAEVELPEGVAPSPEEVEEPRKKGFFARLLDL